MVETIVRGENRGAQWGITLLVIGGSLVRLYNLGKDGLWFDEIDAVTLSSLPLRYMGQGLTFHASPPLDYFILHLVAFVGRSETLVRLPAALFGILTIYALYRAGRHLATVEVGLGAAALVTFCMTAITYAQEARMYSLFLCITTLLLWACSHLIKAPLSWKRWALSGGIAVLSLYTHYYALLILVGLGLMWVGLCFWPRFNSALFVRGGVMFALVALLFAPWLPTMSAQFAARAGALSYALPHAHYWDTIFPFISGGVTYPLLRLYQLLFVFGFLGCLRERRLIAGLLAAFVIIPACLPYFVPALAATVTPRNMIFLIPGYLVGVAIGFHTLLRFTLWLAAQWAEALLPPPRVRALLVGLTFAGLLLLGVSSSARMLWQYPTAGWWMRDAREGWRETARFLQNTMQPTDVVMVNGVRTRYMLSYYLDPLAIEGIHFYDFSYNPANTDTGATRFLPIVTPQTSASLLTETLAPAETVWVIYPEYIDFAALGIDPAQVVPVPLSTIPIARLPGSLFRKTVVRPDE